jgi:hypothetical protein
MAATLIERMGEQAISHAVYQALRARHVGNMPAMEQWEHIAEAVRQILSSEPSDQN